MGLLDTFKRTKPQEPSSAAPQTEISSPDLGTSTSEPSRVPGGDVLDSSSLSSSSSFNSTPDVSGSRFYNPYEGLNTALDSRTARTPYRLPQQPEFLFSEESTFHRRSWSENLTFYTGTGYLTGALLGGGRGALQALPRPPDAPVDSARLRLNRLLNMSGRAGRAGGNSLGALGLFFSVAESGLGYWSDGSVPEELITVAAGAGTGALFRSAHGLRLAGVAGGLGAGAAVVLLIGRQYVSKAL